MNDDLAKLRKRAIKDIVPELAALERRDLVTLLAAEGEESNPRESLIAALTKEIAARDALEAEAQAELEAEAAAEAEAEREAEAEAEREAGSAAEPTAGDDAPAWQHPDFSGPLDVAQASWRALHLKPVRDVITK